MVQGPRVFQPISSKKPFYKNPGAIAAVLVLAAIGGVAAFALKADESTLLSACRRTTPCRRRRPTPSASAA